MSDAKPMYVRVPIDLKEQIDKYASKAGIPTSDAICTLTKNGLTHEYLLRQLNQLTQENQALKLNNERILGQFNRSKFTAKCNTERSAGIKKFDTN